MAAARKGGGGRGGGREKRGIGRVRARPRFARATDAAHAIMYYQAVIWRRSGRAVWAPDL